MTGKYKTVVIDPPWPLKTGKIPLTVTRRSGKWGAKVIDLDYKPATIQEIKAFPINDYAAADCLLFLWVLSGKIDGQPCIKIGLDMLEQWEFNYHQIITWVKETGLCIWSPFRSLTEHVLVGYRGILPKKYAVMNNTFTTQQLKHSEKPARFYQLLREWTPEPRIDLFARQAHEGFDGWGDEYAGDHGPLLPFLKEDGKK